MGASAFLSPGRVPASQQEKGEASMAKIDLDSLGIEELAASREQATETLFEKGAVRRDLAIGSAVL